MACQITRINAIQAGKPQTFTYRGNNLLGHGSLLFAPVKTELVGYDYYAKDLSWLQNGPLLSAPVEIELLGYDYHVKVS